jgi:hypothetical protein
MAKPYSQDLRDRLVRAVLAGHLQLTFKKNSACRRTNAEVRCKPTSTGSASGRTNNGAACFHGFRAPSRNLQSSSSRCCHEEVDRSA